MSRIGKKPVKVPGNVKVHVSGSTVRVDGPKGKLERSFRPEVRVELSDGQIVVSPVNNTRVARALHGLTRTLCQNMVVGVNEGFTKQLTIEGKGFRAQLNPIRIQFGARCTAIRPKLPEVVEPNRAIYFKERELGYSHAILFLLPVGVDAQIDNKGISITLRSCDKELLGQTAARLRSLRPPDPYKGKGILYAGEQIRRKVGKAGR